MSVLASTRFAFVSLRRDLVRAAPALALALALLAPRGALAQSQAAAEALFRSAQDAAEKGDWTTACDRFEESQRLEPAPGTVLNIARCREKLGAWASAWNRYSEAAQKLPPSDPRAALAKRKVEELASKVPHVVLEAPPEGEGLRVMLGELEVARAMFGVPLPVDPGKVVIAVSAGGREDWTTTVEIVDGESRSVALELGPPSQEPAPSADGAAPSETPSPRASRGTAWPWLSLGVGGALLGAGVGFQVWAGNENTVVVERGECVGRECNLEGYEAAQRGQLAQTLGVAAFVGGAALGGLGVFLLVSEAGTSPNSNVSMGVRPTAGGALLSLGGTL